jgi:hypothetical protein
MARYARRPLSGRLVLPGVSKITPETDPLPKRTSHHYAGTLPVHKSQHPRPPALSPSHTRSADARICRAGRACYMLSGPSPAVRPPRQCSPRWRSGDEAGEPFTGDQSVSTSSTASASLRLISLVIRRLPCQVKRVSWPSSLLISALAIRAAWGSASVKTNPDGG